MAMNGNTLFKFILFFFNVTGTYALRTFVHPIKLLCHWFAVEWRRFEVMSIGRESGIVEHYPRNAAIDSGISLKTLLFQPQP